MYLLINFTPISLSWLKGLKYTTGLSGNSFHFLTDNSVVPQGG